MYFARFVSAFSHPLIAPAIVNHSALPSASGRFATPRGELAVSWAYDSGRVALNVTLPPNVKATVMVPCTTPAVQEGGNPEGQVPEGQVPPVNAEVPVNEEQTGN